MVSVLARLFTLGINRLPRHEFLEDQFPAYPTGRKSGPKRRGKELTRPTLSKRNTAIKLILDQTLSAAFNTVLFSVFHHSVQSALSPTAVKTSSFLEALCLLASPKGLDFSEVDYRVVWEATANNFWPIMRANWRLWPVVALLNFTLVKTVQMRSLVLALAGLGWRVFLSLFTAR